MFFAKPLQRSNLCASHRQRRWLTHGELGSHFVTHTDWGCEAGVHCGWLIVELESRDEALRIVPPELRPQARIIQLNRFTREQITSRIADLKD